MSLNRNQTTLCAIGGIFGVGAVALGWFLWSAVDESGRALQERDNSMGDIDSYYSAKVFPSAESLEAVNARIEELSNWRENAKLLAARGDKSFGEMTPPSFKQFLQSEQVRLSALPGRSANGKICAAGFAFGFDKYLGQNPTMPEMADIPKLQRQLDFIAEAVELFAEAGIDEVKSVKRDDTAATAVEEEPRPAPRASKSGKKGKGAAADEGPLATSLEYKFQLLASPKALVSVVNKLNSGSRFTVVTGLDFVESHDVIVENIAARDKAENDAKLNQGSKRKHRRRGEAAEQAGVDAEGKPSNGGIVIDPEIDAPLAVDLAVTVYDFGQGLPVVEAAPAPEGENAAPAASADAPAPAASADAPAPAADKPAAPAEEVKEETAK